MNIERSANNWDSRFKEIDLRFITRDLKTINGVRRFPLLFAHTLFYELLYELYRHTFGRNKMVKKPIFMVGLPHSGTTISMKLLATHPDIANFSEVNTILQPLGYFDYKNGDHFKTENDATKNEFTRLHSRFSFHCWLKDKNRFFNKSPMNSVRISFLREIFPDAFFIHIIRDGRGVVNSLIRGLPAKWETEDRFKKVSERRNPFPGTKPPNWRELLRDNPIEQHALQWCEVIKYALEDGKRCGAKVKYIRYEDLCENTKDVMNDIFSFCELGTSKNKQSKIPAKLTSQNYKWKNNFSQAEILLIVNIQSEVLKKFGYL